MCYRDQWASIIQRVWGYSQWCNVIRNRRQCCGHYYRVVSDLLSVGGFRLATDSLSTRNRVVHIRFRRSRLRKLQYLPWAKWRGCWILNKDLLFRHPFKWSIDRSLLIHNFGFEAASSVPDKIRWFWWNNCRELPWSVRTSGVTMVWSTLFRMFKLLVTVTVISSIIWLRSIFPLNYIIISKRNLIFTRNF